MSVDIETTVEALHALLSAGAEVVRHCVEAAGAEIVYETTSCFV